MAERKLLRDKVAGATCTRLSRGYFVERHFRVTVLRRRNILSDIKALPMGERCQLFLVDRRSSLNHAINVRTNGASKRQISEEKRTWCVFDDGGTDGDDGRSEGGTSKFRLFSNEEQEGKWGEATV